MNKACSVCEFIRKREGSIKVSDEFHRSVGFISSDFLRSAEAVDEIRAKELRLGWWGLVEAASPSCMSIGNVNEFCEGKGIIWFVG